MQIALTHADTLLLERYLESVLLRYRDDKYSLADATQELSQAFVQLARGDAGFRDHMLGVVEAGDDA